jgi:hypothetical protein
MTFSPGRHSRGVSHPFEEMRANGRNPGAGGGTFVLEHQLDLLKRYGFTDVFVRRLRGEAIERHVGDGSLSASGRAIRMNIPTGCWTVRVFQPSRCFRRNLWSVTAIVSADDYNRLWGRSDPRPEAMMSVFRIGECGQ